MRIRDQRGIEEEREGKMAGIGTRKRQNRERKESRSQVRGSGEDSRKSSIIYSGGHNEEQRAGFWRNKTVPLIEMGLGALVDSR